MLHKIKKDYFFVEKGHSSQLLIVIRSSK